MTVVPGMMVYAPRQSWHSLRNTGTGMLEVAWLAAPPGIEEFFREYSRLGTGADAAAMQALAQRYGIEFGPGGSPAPSGAKPSGRRHRRRHRGGRGPRQGTTQPQQVAAGEHATTPSTVQPGAAVAAPSPHRPPGGGRRPHRRRHRSRPGGPSAAAVSDLSAPPATSSPSAPSRPQLPPKPRAVRGGGPRRRGRIKEVYMGGRWIQVSGEGPVIDPGRERPSSGRPGPRRDDDTPGPLSVPL